MNQRSVEPINTGNSSKRWVAHYENCGQPVLTATGERTVFQCTSREAERIERMYNIYLTEVDA